ncbi:amidohydrolase [Bacillus sp. T3]|uniref:amidohydrolase n=1 Tax=Bacillus sp. T3 TaxID=467262 RepID=UPI002981B448|nr:amidohydrolase [Bacillus sp. T3]
MDPLQYIDQHKEALLNTFHELHALAEPSWEEKKTSAYIENLLRKAGLNVKTFNQHYGIIAEIPGLTQHVVALRADLDALLQEVNGVVKANHSCGHDAHSTMVLYTALSIAASGFVPKQTLRFIFQPAEEKGEGALQMIKEGALNNVFSLFGIHLRPIFEIPPMKASPVIVHGSAGTVKGTIQGIQAHASRPQDGINAIEVAAMLVEKLRNVSLETDVPYSIKMTQLQVANEASNIIPGLADFSLDLRAQTNEVMDELQKKLTQIVSEVSTLSGAKINWKLADLVPAAIQNETAKKIATQAIVDILGKENIIPVCTSNGGEDFHFYTAKSKGLKATMIGLGCGLSPGLHHPEMTFHLDALLYGTKILTKTILLASEQSS